MTIARYGGSHLDKSGVTDMAFFRFLFNLLWFVLEASSWGWPGGWPG